MRAKPAFVRHTSTQSRKKQRGFSLLEIMVAIVLIGLIGGVIGPAVIGMFVDGKRGIAKNQLCSFEKNLQVYYMRKGRYPTDSEGLHALFVEGIIPRKIKKDPWGNPYVYRRENRINPRLPDLFSYGKDGKEDGRGQDKDIRCHDS